MKAFTKRYLVVMLALLMAWNMSSVAQAARRNNREGDEKEYNVLAEAPYGGTRVLSFSQGRRFDGLAVMGIRSRQNTTLTYEIGMSESNFFSLGFGTTNEGWIIIEFENPIQNGPGNDIRVVEDTWSLPYPKETAGIYISNDGNNWIYLGEANNQNPISSYHTISEFNLDKVCLKEARYVKVQDMSILEHFAKLSPANKYTLDGYDLNVVLALHDYAVEIDDGCHSGGGSHNNGGYHNNGGKKNSWFANLCKWTWRFTCNGFANYRW